MSLTQIPFQDPVAPEKPQPEQLDLYAARDWETAYRVLDDDARIPHLLIQLQDDLARSRRREAIWISIIVHMLLIAVLYFGKYLPWHTVVAKNPQNLNSATFLELPPDLQKAPHKPSNIASDKDRIATTRHPELDSKQLRKMLATPPPGAPGMNAPPSPRTAPPAQSAQAFPPNQQSSPTQQRPQQAPNPETAQLQIPAKPNVADLFKKYAAEGSAGSQINQAEAATAAARGAGQGQGGDFGLGTGAHGRQLGNLEVLSDTMGVDFGPYLKRVLFEVRQNWYHLIPESAEWKKGKLVIEFAIMKDGSVQGLKVVAPSGDSTLDEPAYGSIKASNPFPPLPTEFPGQYLALRFVFFYNPSKEDLE
jgi:TonB family protein